MAASDWLTWLIFADEVVLHVAAVVVPLVQVSPAQTRKCSGLVVHDDAGLAATGRLIKVPVPARSGLLWLPLDITSLVTVAMDVSGVGV